MPDIPRRLLLSCLSLAIAGCLALSLAGMAAAGYLLIH